MPVPGYRTKTTSNLRLWNALPVEEFDLSAFNEGNYDAAVAARRKADDITAVLYPNDATPYGKELRLKQQFFFVSASLQVGAFGTCLVEHVARCPAGGPPSTRLPCFRPTGHVKTSKPPDSWRPPFPAPAPQDTLSRFLSAHSDLSALPDKACFQMNDTHPTITVAELMRLLVDVHGLAWDAAWGIVTRCLA